MGRATVTIGGNVAAEPRFFESKSNPEGGVLSLRVPVDVYNRETREKDTTWYGVKLFGKSAQRLKDQVRKGSGIMVSGDLEMDTYTDKSGETRTTPVVKAFDLTFVGPRPVGGDNAAGSDMGGFDGGGSPF